MDGTTTPETTASESTFDILPLEVKDGRIDTINELVYRTLFQEQRPEKGSSAIIAGTPKIDGEFAYVDLEGCPPIVCAVFVRSGDLWTLDELR